MKIISKFKDYYDFLSGKYGVDPKVVLDRRSATPQYKFYNLEKAKLFRLYICGQLIEGIHFEDKFYYGEDLGKIGKVIEKQPWGSLVNTSKKRYRINADIAYFQHYDRDVNAEIIKDKTEVNKKENCPIIFAVNKDEYYYYPILSALKIQKHIPPETIYNWLVDWISDKNEEKENQEISMTDVLKLQAKGFDKKTSFRNIK